MVNYWKRLRQALNRVREIAVFSKETVYLVITFPLYLRFTLENGKPYLIYTLIEKLSEVLRLGSESENGFFVCLFLRIWCLALWRRK